MTDADIHAFGSEPPLSPRASGVVKPSPTRRWPWVPALLAALALLLMLAVAGGAAALWSMFSSALPPDMNVVVNGEPHLWWELQEEGWSGSVFSALLIGTVVVLTVVFLVVPAVLLAVVLSLLGGGLCVALALAAVVGGVGLVLALLLSPLWLFALLLWLLLRKPKAGTARMAA